MFDDIQIVPVGTSQELKRFIRIPANLYSGDRHFIPPLELERLDALRPGKNPYFEHAEARFFIAMRGGRDVGRISAQVDRLVADPQLGFFGLLAAENDPAVFRALFAAAEGWLRERGRTVVRGPFSLSINEETGLLIDGFDAPPMIFMPHDPPYAAAQVEAQGYAKARDVIAYLYDVVNGFPEDVMRLVRRAESRGIRIRHIDMSRIEEEFRLVMDIFNDAWSQNWGFIPFTEAELTHMAKGLKPLLDPRWTAIAEYEGEAVAFGILLPNLNEAIRDFNGRLLPFNWLKLLLRIKRGTRTGRVPLMGVRRSFAGGLLGGMVPLAVIHSLQRHAKPKGMVSAELSWILEDNRPMRRMIEALGATGYKTYRVYEKRLG
ncbi:MAG: dATP pyrophosphohydrolase [Pseudomonadota bacterium]|nr:dATP pyrophosphohydrolase [Pseudomonadota bacterium]